MAGGRQAGTEWRRVYRIHRMAAGDYPWYVVPPGRPPSLYDAAWVGATRVVPAREDGMREEGSQRFFPSREALVQALDRVGVQHG